MESRGRSCKKLILSMAYGGQRICVTRYLGI